MKWIILAVVLFIVPYTYLTLRYRKPTSFQPFEEARERKHIQEVGYTRVSCRITRPADKPAGGPAELAAAPAGGGLPADLATHLVDRPVLPVQITGVRAAESCAATDEYPVRFRCQPPAGNVEFAAAHVYRKEHTLVIVAEFAPVADGLVQRGAENEATVIVPSGSFDPGSYQVTLAGSLASRTWPLQVH